MVTAVPPEQVGIQHVGVAAEVSPMGSNVWSCLVSWKVTLGECGWGVVSGEKVCCSLAMASMLCWPLILDVPLRVTTIASARATGG